MGRGHCREKLRHLGVEQGVRPAPDHLQRFFRQEGAAVRADGDGGVVALGNGEDPGRNRYVLSAQAVRVARPVEMFVVLENRPARRVHSRYPFQHLRPQEGVLPNHLRLLLAQPALLRQEVPGNADDPHVMQFRGVPQGGEVGLRKPHPLADPRGQIAHPIRVSGEEGEAQLERVRQGGEDGKGTPEPGRS